ncbi:spore gernimation protein GerT [Metabacillus litoralis]|uniref:Spore gernimation protein GerT n=1 Tax=Metabacillus litoralis TaxID=152268 RepID=A0A5C6W736_9BACI|nr:Hsp20/alpha crystallin family protein [Metabacillus litoralis]TXC93153.1 spore gernimation protein GerT [Metabacillus litoralis]
MFPWNKQFPFDQSSFTKNLNKMNPKEVENYIQNVMKNVFGGDLSQSFPFQGDLTQNERVEKVEKPTPEIFETNEFVYVKLNIPKNHDKDIKLQHTNHQLLVKNYPKQGDVSKYMLPAPVKRKGTKARYIDHYLEIQLVKLDENSISEVDIT